jgi:hypothetical protein
MNKINPQLKQKRKQKDINTQINASVQTILLYKNSIEDELNKLVKNSSL